MLFRELDLNPNILAALEAKGYETPTPIQAASIPPILEGKDLLGCAQTGTGKTAAFALPILQNLSKNTPVKSGAIRALVLSPTRELAVQIGDSFLAYGKGQRLRVATIFGGVSDYPQKQKLRQGVDILVATPGRLMDLLGQRALSLDSVEIFTLDEADRMMDMGFIHDVRRIAALLPAQRQTLFFSATMPNDIRALSKALLNNPVNVEVTPVSSAAPKIEQSVYYVNRSLKPALLRHLLTSSTISRALVFTRTKHGADRVCRALERTSVVAEAIHGNKTQGARQRALTNFKNGRTRVLVATDIASRGIDVNDVTHVFNYDLPEVAETYVHRIGRTARAGASGIAVAFCDSDERSYLKQIERLTRQQLPIAALPVLESLPSDAADRPPRRDYGDNDRAPRSSGGSHSRGPVHSNHSGSSHSGSTHSNHSGGYRSEGSRDGGYRGSSERSPDNTRPSREGSSQGGQGGHGRPSGGREYTPFWKKSGGSTGGNRRPSSEPRRG